MSDDNKKPDPIEDVRKGLGLLFRAARNAVDEIPTDKLEGVVRTGAREVTRVIETVTGTIEKEIFGGKGTGTATPPSAPPPAAAGPAAGGDPSPPVATTQASAAGDPPAAAAPPAEAKPADAPKEPIITPPPDSAKGA